MSTADPFEELLAPSKNNCLETLNKTETVYKPGKYCPGTWDGWLCWPDTIAGTTAYAHCPEFVTGFDPLRFGHKDCNADGTWFRHPDSNKIWSNYTTCIDLPDFESRRKVNLIYEVGYSVSFIAILLSLIIYSYFRSLKCARITIHMNLFVSFAANNLLWILWYRLVIAQPDVTYDSPTICIVMHIVLHYFLLSNYAWMLCEGFYLHTVLVSAFISEQRLVRWLMLFGWLVPAIVCLVYTLARGLNPNIASRMHCWMAETEYTNILVAPVCLSILLNLVFLCNIVRVLLMKLKSPAGSQGANAPSRNILQAFRATLLLVPLLGMQYILTPFKPEAQHRWEFAYEIVSAFTASFQGLCVATLFCFCNGEVIAQIKRKWRTIFYSHRPRSNSYTATQVSFVRNGPPVPGEEKV